METSPPQAEVAPVERTHLADRNPTHIGIVIFLGFFATALSNPSRLGKLSINHILKDQLHVTASGLSLFGLITGLAWYCKPIAGILTDAFPIFGTRRRHYLILSVLLAGVCWLAAGMVPKTLGSLTLIFTIVNCFLVMASTVLGAYLVESGQYAKATGRLTALRMFAMHTGFLMAGPLGGLLAGTAFMFAAGANAILVAALVPVVYFFLRERPQTVAASDSLTKTGDQLGTILRSPTLWWAVLFTAFFYFAPGFGGSALYFIQKDKLRFTDPFIGSLTLFSGGAGLLAAVCYGYISRRLPLRTLISLGAAAASLTALSYLFYTGPKQALVAESLYGFGTALADLAFIDLAARATPPGCEGLGYALIVSVNNLISQLADYLASKLYDHKVPFSELVILNAATTALILVLLPFVSTRMLGTRDS